jgi:tetratricopeptide (TPR) repeat protein
MDKLKSIALYLFFASVFYTTGITGVFAQRQTESDLALQYASTGECDKALVYFEKWYNRDPNAAYQPFLSCYLQLKDYDQAEKLVKKHIKKFSTNATLWVDLGQVYDAGGKPDVAKQQYDKAVKSLYPDVQQVINLGGVFVEKRLLNYAEATYLQGRNMVGQIYPFSFELADVYAQMNQGQKMVDEYLNLLEVNEVYLANVQAILQNKMAFDLEGGLTDIIRTSLLRRVQKGTQKIIYNELLYWLLLQEKDFSSALIQAKALDKRNDENGNRIISLGQLCVSNEEYAIAEACYDYVIGKGKQNPYYITARMELIAARDKKITTSGNYTIADLQKLELDYEATFAELGKTPITASLVSKYAHLKAFYLKKTEEAITLLEETIAMPRVSPQFVAECKLELGDILILTGEVWDASLLYSQVDKDFKNDALGREAKFRNARLSYYLGEFEWAAAQLGVLKAATSQLISNDAMKLGLLIMDNLGMDSITEPLQMYSRADLYDFCNRYDQALATLDSLETAFPAHSLTDEIWFKKAEIYFKKGDFQKAAEFYFRVFEVYPDDILADDALFLLAEITEQKLRENQRAKELYELLLTRYPGSLFTVEARKRFRFLRGDVGM